MFQIKIIKNLFLAMTLCFAFFGDIFAVPALPRLLKITQPNGTEFKAYLKGDEYYSWWESEKGTLLFRNMESGYFEYAKISLIESKEQLVSTGVIYVAGEETSIPSTRILNMTKLNLGKIWRKKREDARKYLQKIIEKQRQTENK